MIEFVNIENEVSFQERSGIPSKGYGLLYAKKDKPLPFQYQSTEAVSTFVAKLVDSLGNVSETISLSISLINADGEYHLCDGLNTYASNLSCGYYYFLVNSKYQSEYFKVDTNLTDGTLNQPVISIAGLEFFNNEHTVPWRDRIGKPSLFYGIQYAENSTPLYFDYLASEAVTSFKAVRVDNLGNDIEEFDLSTSLISVTDHHICDGLTDFSQSLVCGIYYFIVNGKYESELFQTIELENDVWVLETGIWENGNTVWTSDGIWNTV